VPAAARANHAVFYREGRALSLDQVYASFEGKFPGSAQVASGITENGTATISEVARFATKVAIVPIKAASVAALSDSYPGAENSGQITGDPGFIDANSSPTATSHSLANHVAFFRDRTSLQQSPSQATLFALQLMQSMTLPEAEDGPAKRNWRA
jgi:hypothetical protein